MRVTGRRQAAQTITTAEGSFKGTFGPVALWQENKIAVLICISSGEKKDQAVSQRIFLKLQSRRYTWRC
jgi:hypothetical protein